MYLTRHLVQFIDETYSVKVERKIINRKKKVGDLFKNWVMSKNFAQTLVDEDMRISKKTAKCSVKDLSV